MGQERQSQECKTCGHPNNIGDISCKKCGSLLEVSNPQPKQPPNQTGLQDSGQSGQGSRPLEPGVTPVDERSQEQEESAVRRIWRNITTQWGEFPLWRRIVVIAVIVVVVTGG